MAVSAKHSLTGPLLADDVSHQERFRVVHQLYCDGIWRYLRRLGLRAAEADDASQQVFFIIAKKLDAVRRGSERAFAYEVASRVASDVRRSAARRYEIAAAAPGETTEASGSRPDELHEERRRIAILDGILSALAPELRQVLVLFEIEELPMREIAEVLKIPPGTVASRLRRAREEFQREAARHRKEGTP